MLTTIQAEQSDVEKLQSIAKRDRKPVEQVLHELLLNVESETLQETKNLLNEIDTFQGFKAKSTKTTTEIIREDRETRDGRNIK